MVSGVLRLGDVTLLRGIAFVSGLVSSFSSDMLTTVARAFTDRFFCSLLCLRSNSDGLGPSKTFSNNTLYLSKLVLGRSRSSLGVLGVPATCFSFIDNGESVLPCCTTLNISSESLGLFKARNMGENPSF